MPTITIGGSKSGNSTNGNSGGGGRNYPSGSGRGDHDGGGGRNYPSGSGRGDHDGGGRGFGGGSNSGVNAAEEKSPDNYSIESSAASTRSYIAAKYSIPSHVVLGKGGNVEKLPGHQINLECNNITTYIWQQVEVLQDGKTRGPNVLKHIKAINLCGNDLLPHDAISLIGCLKWQFFDLDHLFLHRNRIGDEGVIDIMSSLNNPLRLHDGAIRTNYIKHLNLGNNSITDIGAKAVADALSDGRLSALTRLDLSGNNFTSVGLEHLATSVRKIKAKTIAIKVATADTLQEMKEFLTKGFNYYTKTHKVVATKEFQDELLGVKTSACEKTKDNAKEAFLTGAFVASLTTGNDVLILAAGAEAGAGALLSPDALQCCKEIIGDLQDLYDEY
jgi:hypothetical protein